MVSWITTEGGTRMTLRFLTLATEQMVVTVTELGGRRTSFWEWEMNFTFIGGASSAWSTSRYRC